jgi:hypothetical protein
MRTLPSISLVVRYCPTLQKLRPAIGSYFSPRAAALSALIASEYQELVPTEYGY